MQEQDQTDEIVLTREVGLKTQKKKLNFKKILIPASIITLVGAVVIALVFLIQIAKVNL